MDLEHETNHDRMEANKEVIPDACFIYGCCCGGLQYEDPTDDS